jgi:mannose-6-phosphate isomerase-like protein (cupin superfamily)|tara:strand:+ start:514 stop:915 length:402 start_codon:yes stop_codon:yes gene_type:complete
MTSSRIGPSRKPKSPRAAEPVKRVPKGWGHELWIANCEKYCGKLLYIKKGKQCSWHFHKLKDEVFYIQSGKVKIYYGWDDKIELAHVALLEVGDKFHVPIGLKHRMYALEDTELFEFSTEHFDEDSHRVIPGD